MDRDLVVGVDVGGSRVKFVVCGAGGECVRQGSVATAANDPRGTIGRLASEIRREAGKEADRLVAVGMACAGIVGARSGRLGRSPNLPGWEGMNLVAEIGMAFDGLPAVVANDVNAALFGEWRLGAGRGRSDLVMIALGTGVGGAVIVDGRLVTGREDGAGEIGHMILDMDGPSCTCGNRGCLEAFIGEWALVQRARQLAADTNPDNAELTTLVGQAGDRLDSEDLYRLATGGDRVTAALFTEAGRKLGQAIANVVNLLDPDLVIVGGGVSQAGDLLLEPCRQVVRSAVLAVASRQIPIVTAELGTHAAALGAAAMAREGV